MKTTQPDVAALTDGVEAREFVGGNSHQCVERVGGHDGVFALDEFGKDVMDDGAALTAVRTVPKRIERPQSEHMLGINVVGRAHQRFDLGDRERARAGTGGRIGCGARGRPDLLDGIEAAGLIEPGSAFFLPVLRGGDAGKGLQALQQARSDGGRGADAVGIGNDHLCIAQRLDKVMGGQALAALGRIGRRRDACRG